MLFHAYGAGSRASPAVGSGESLMQVKMNNIKPHVTGPGESHTGIEIGSVIVEKAAFFMYDGGDLQNILVKKAQGIGIGQHEPRHLFCHSLFQG